MHSQLMANTIALSLSLCLLLSDIVCAYQNIGQFQFTVTKNIINILLQCSICAINFVLILRTHTHTHRERLAHTQSYKLSGQFQ